MQVKRVSTLGDIWWYFSFAEVGGHNDAGLNSEMCVAIRARLRQIHFLQYFLRYVIPPRDINVPQLLASPLQTSARELSLLAFSF